MHHRFRSLTRFRSEPTPTSRFCLFLSFGASVTLGVRLNGTVPNQLKPCAWLVVSPPPWRGDTTSPLKKKKRGGGTIGLLLFLPTNANILLFSHLLAHPPSATISRLSLVLYGDVLSYSEIDSLALPCPPNETMGIRQIVQQVVLSRESIRECP